MPGPGAGDHRVPAESAGGGVEGAGDRDRLVLAAVGRRGGDVAAEQAALAQLGDVAAERARQGASPGLHVADLEPGRCLSRRPGRRRQVPVQRQDQDRHRRLRPLPVRLLHLQRRIRRTGSSTGSTGCWSEV